MSAQGKTIAKVLVTEFEDGESADYIAVYCDYLEGTGDGWSTFSTYTLQSEGRATELPEPKERRPKSNSQPLSYDWRWRPIASLNDGSFGTQPNSPSQTQMLAIRRRDLSDMDRRQSLLNLHGKTLRVSRDGANIADFVLLSYIGEDPAGSVCYYCKYVDGTDQPWVKDAVYRIELDNSAPTPAERAISNP